MENQSLTKFPCFHVFMHLEFRYFKIRTFIYMFYLHKISYYLFQILVIILKSHKLSYSHFTYLLGANECFYFVLMPSTNSLMQNTVFTKYNDRLKSKELFNNLISNKWITDLRFYLKCPLTKFGIFHSGFANDV